jgi:hypothetical protein
MKMYIFAFATLLMAAGTASADVETNVCNREFSNNQNEAYQLHFCDRIFNQRNALDSQFGHGQGAPAYKNSNYHNSKS